MNEIEFCRCVHAHVVCTCVCAHVFKCMHVGKTCFANTYSTSKTLKKDIGDCYGDHYGDCN